MDLQSRAQRLLVHHVAKRLGLSRRMVRYLAATGLLEARKHGEKIWWFDPEDVENYRRRRKHAAS